MCLGFEVSIHEILSTRRLIYDFIHTKHEENLRVCSVIPYKVKQKDTSIPKFAWGGVN